MEWTYLLDIWLRIWVVFIMDISLIRSASIRLRAMTGVLGEHRTIVSCRFFKTDSETLSQFRLSRRQTKDYYFTEVCDYTLSRGFQKHLDQHTDLINRTEIYFDLDYIKFIFKLNRIICSDEGEFQCSAIYTRSNISHQVSENIKFKVEAAPEKPVMKYNPKKTTYELMETVWFSCTGNVGRPPGWFWWFSFENFMFNNVTDKAHQSDAVPASGSHNCTYVRTSVYRLVMAKTNGIVMKCVAYHPSQMTKTSLLDCLMSKRCSESTFLNVNKNNTRTIIVVVILLGSIFLVASMSVYVIRLKYKRRRKGLQVIERDSDT